MNKIAVCLLTVLINLTCVTLHSQEDRRSAAISNTQSAEVFQHIVEPGQTVYSIARMYGVGEEDIYKLNPQSRTIIKVGDKLQIPQKDAASTITATEDELNYTFHTIAPKETLYSLSKGYNIPAKDIVDANPGLSVASFQIGKTIRIPTTKIEYLPQKDTQPVVREIEYKVERRETMFRLTRKFNITAEELIARNPELKNGVKAGMIIIIPVQTEETVTSNPVASAPRERDINALLSPSKKIEKVDMIKAAILLPFMTEEAIPSSNTARFIEYYEGILLAVDSLKSLGVSIELIVRDTGKGTDKLTQILNDEALQNVQLIIGAVENDQIKPIADFARKHNIKYVIPFTSKNDEVLSNASIFQVNTPHSYLYENASKAAFNQLFYDYNIIFVDTKDKDDKAEFIKRFKLELTNHKVVFRDLVYNAATFVNDVEALLSKSQRNVIIPISGTLEALNKIRGPLRTLVDNRNDYMINMFGYPEWQTYTRDALDDLFALDTYIYTNFYADNMSNEVSKFYSKYKVWFSKNPINTFPKYSILGFDTGMFFFGAINKYGREFEEHLDKINYKSIQTGFEFVRPNNWGGYINTKLFIVHYNKRDYQVVRHEIKK